MRFREPCNLERQPSGVCLARRRLVSRARRQAPRRLSTPVSWQTTWQTTWQATRRSSTQVGVEAGGQAAVSGVDLQEAAETAAENPAEICCVLQWIWVPGALSARSRIGGNGEDVGWKWVTWGRLRSEVRFAGRVRVPTLRYYDDWVHGAAPGVSGIASRSWESQRTPGAAVEHQNTTGCAGCRRTRRDRTRPDLEFADICGGRTTGCLEDHVTPGRN